MRGDAMQRALVVVPEGDRRSGLAAPGTAGRRPVGAAEGDAGGVVVQLGAVDPEGPHRAHDHLGEQAGPVGVEEPLQDPPHPVIVEQRRLPRAQTQSPYPPPLPSRSRPLPGMDHERPPRTTHSRDARRLPRSWRDPPPRRTRKLTPQRRPQTLNEKCGKRDHLPTRTRMYGRRDHNSVKKATQQLSIWVMQQGVGPDAPKPNRIQNQTRPLVSSGSTFPGRSCSSPRAGRVVSSRNDS